MRRPSTLAEVAPPLRLDVASIDVMQFQQENAAQLLPSAPKRTGPARRTRRAVLLETVAEEAADLDTSDASQQQDPTAGVSHAD
jgi:hypothetical protein